MTVDTSVVVSVVLTADNADRTIARQLSALASQTAAGSFEIVVVDSGTDDTKGVVESFSTWLALLRYVENTGRGSHAGARNRAVSSARGELLLFCRADDEVDSHWVSRMVAALTTADVVGGRLTPREDTPRWATECALPQALDLPVDEHGFRYAMSASLGCRRAVFDAIGGWDERLAPDGDDMAFSLAAQRLGFRMGYAREAICRQYVPITYRRVVSHQWRRGVVEARFRTQFMPECDDGLVASVVRAAARFGRAVRHDSSIHVWLSASVRSLRGVATAVSTAATHRPVEELRLADRYIRPQLTRVPIVNRWSGIVRMRASNAWRRPVVDFTFPLRTPVLHGLGARAPRNVAAWYADDASSCEPTTLALVAEVLAAGDHVLDIGANIGTFSLAAASIVGRSGSITALEPNAWLLPTLRDNLDRHSASVVVIEAAAAATSGKMELIIEPNVLLSGVVASPHGKGFGHPATVRSVAIDDLNLPDLALIKIDVEGFEPRVLDGMTSTVQRTPETFLIFEVNPLSLEAAGHTAHELLFHPVLHGRRLYYLRDAARAGVGPPVVPVEDVLQFIRSLPHGEPWYGNLIAVPAQLAAEFDAACHDVAHKLSTGFADHT